MSIKSGKISNYVGQAKEKNIDKLDAYLASIDRELQNLWWALNSIMKLKGIDSAQLATNASLSFNYMPSMIDDPQATPTNYTGQAAYAFCTSDSSLAIYNTRDTSWKTVALS